MGDAFQGKEASPFYNHSFLRQLQLILLTVSKIDLGDSKTSNTNVC